MRIDTHQHFWKFSPQAFPWIGESRAVMQRDFLPPDLQPLLEDNEFDGTVAVQALQTLEETQWLLDLSDQYPFIQAVVGWVDLRSDRVGEQLDRFAHHPKFRGVRHIVQDESDGFMAGAAFRRGIQAVWERGLAYDLLVFPKQLPAAIDLVGRFPKQKFVLDHLAKPDIEAGEPDPWLGLIRELAQHPNVFCKLSGLVTEADWGNWSRDQFTPFLNGAWEAFGPGRLMVGSDWPVCLSAASYDEVIDVAWHFLQQYRKADREAVLGGNAVRFYGLG